MQAFVHDSSYDIVCQYSDSMICFICSIPRDKSLDCHVKSAKMYESYLWLGNKHYQHFLFFAHIVLKSLSSQGF